MKKIILLILAILIKAPTFSQQTSTFTDLRDGKTYKTIKIGNQVWMAENLNFYINDSWCYNNDTVNCKQYGRLYTWEAATKACPSGWHLPSKDEFDVLLKGAGKSSYDAYDYLIQGGISGFSAQLGGFRKKDDNFRNIGKDANLWSSSYDKNGQLGLFIWSSRSIAMMVYYKSYLSNSVRCIKDN